MKNTQSNSAKKIKKHPQIIKAVVLVASACLLIVGAYFLIVSRGGFVQTQVQATILGPDQIDAGQTEQFEVVIKNTSDRSIEIGVVRVKLLSDDDFSEALEFADDGTTEKKFEGAQVDPGGEFKEVVNVTSIQSEDRAKITVIADYSPQDLSVQFFANDSQDLVIGSLDADVSVSIPEIAFVGEQIKGSISITPHTSLEQDDLYMVLTTTGDFEIQQATPQFADRGRLRWSLDKFESESTQTFSFTGVSENATDVNISVEIGRYEGLVFKPLSLHKHEITVSHIPLLVLVEPKKSATTVTSQERVEFEAVVSNKGDTDLKNIVVDITLPTQVMQDDSFTLSNNEQNTYAAIYAGNAAQVSYESSEVLKTLAPGEEQPIEFSFQLKDFTTLTPAIDKQHTIEVEARGLANNGSSISNSYETEIVLEGTTKLVQQVVRNSSLLQGKGPIPPVVGQETSYIVVWELQNDINSIDTAKVEVIIPNYVRYKGVVRPANENVEYDQTQNIIRWNIGKFAESKRTVHFEVWVTPNQIQAGRQIPILDTTIFTAQNPATKKSIHDRFSSVSTASLDDNTSLFEGIVENKEIEEN